MNVPYWTAFCTGTYVQCPLPQPAAPGDEAPVDASKGAKKKRLAIEPDATKDVTSSSTSATSIVATSSATTTSTTITVEAKHEDIQSRQGKKSSGTSSGTLQRQEKALGTHDPLVAVSGGGIIFQHQLVHHILETEEA